jgi:hypothetical protein
LVKKVLNEVSEGAAGLENKHAIELQDEKDHRNYEELQKDKNLYSELVNHLKSAREQKFTKCVTRIAELKEQMN